MGLPIHELRFTADDPYADAPFEFPSFTTHPQSRKTFEAMPEAEVDAYVAAYRSHIDEAVRQSRPDLVHAQHMWVAATCAVDTEVPVVVTSHGTDVMGFKSSLAFRQMVAPAVRKVRATIAVSNDVARSLVILFDVPQSRLRVIHNGVEARLFHPRAASAADTLAELDLPALGKRIVAFVGKLTWFKGVDLLMRAAQIYEQEATDVATLIVGDGLLRDDLEGLAGQLGLQRCVLAGALAHERVADVYNAAELTCVPSRGEPFSLVALESMACGTPVVGFESGGLPEFVTPERGTLVEREDSDALAAAVLDALANDAKRTKGPAAVEFAKRERSWGRVVDDTLDVYAEALSEPTP